MGVSNFIVVGVFDNRIPKNGSNEENHIYYYDIPHLSYTIKSAKVADDSGDECFKGRRHLGNGSKIKVLEATEGSEKRNT